MKLYKETVHCTVNLPVDANKIIESEAQRTGIQKAIFLRCLILKWVEKKKNGSVGGPTNARHRT